ncbi:MAG: hypothetical protein IJO88_06225 [Oscillospiraceae bacterium]|nr:hypothetical protein [Oscillospiraceae bacterium]
MSRIEELFTPELIEAAKDEKKLPQVLEQIYERGFSDAVKMEDIAPVFARRLLEIDQEFEAQLERYVQSKDAWYKALVEDLGTEASLTVNGMCHLAASMHGDALRKEEIAAKLERREALGPHRPEEDLALLKLVEKTPMDGAFPRRYAASKDAKLLVLPLSGLLAMGIYTLVKRERPPYIAPDLSFDAVCFWSRGLAQTICFGFGAAAAVVSSVLACAYMHVTAFPVLCGCAASLIELSYMAEDVLEHLKEPLELDRQRCGSQLADVGAVELWSEALSREMQAQDVQMTEQEEGVETVLEEQEQATEYQ